MSVMAGESDAPITPLMIANVVMVPSVAPYTKSAKYLCLEEPARMNIV